MERITIQSMYYGCKRDDTKPGNPYKAYFISEDQFNNWIVEMHTNKSKMNYLDTNGFFVNEIYYSSLNDYYSN